MNKVKGWRAEVRIYKVEGCKSHTDNKLVFTTMTASQYLKTSITSLQKEIQKLTNDSQSYEEREK